MTPALTTETKNIPQHKITKLASLSVDGHVGRKTTSLKLSVTASLLTMCDFTRGRGRPFYFYFFVVDDKIPCTYRFYMG